MHKIIFASQSARELFKENDLDSFAALWSLKLPWFEEPNYRREGWSGVCKTTLQTGTQGAPVFIKRQENHNYKSPLHPVTGRPTLYREFSYARKFNEKDLLTYDVMLYAEEKINDKLCAVMVTHALDNHQTLDEWIDSDPAGDPKKREAVIKVLAQNIRHMHDSGFQHGCLYGKHIMVRCFDDDVDIRFIDLEKVRSGLLRLTVPLQDLDQFFRHHEGAWQTADSELFIKYYRGSQSTQGFTRRLRKRLLRKEPLKAYLLDFT